MFAKYKLSGVLLVLAVVFLIFGYFLKPNQSNAPTIDNFTWQVDRKDMPAEIRAKYEEKRQGFLDKISKKEDLQLNYFELGNIERNLGNLKEAVNAYNGSIAVQDGALARNNLADTYAEAGDYVNAEINYRKAIEINPSYTIYWRKLADFIYDKLPDRRSEIKNIYLEAMNKVEEKQKINIITAYARYLDNMGDYKESLRQWQQALILMPDNESIKAEAEALKTKAAE